MPATTTRALDTLRLWQPAIAALVGGAPETVTAERLQALLGFLDALRPVASPDLAAAIDRGRRRLALDGWEGLTMADALGRLDDLVCARTATFPSVLCRLEDADELVTAGVPAGKLATKVAVSLDRSLALAVDARGGRGER